MELEEQEGVDPVIERRCGECGVELTQREIQSALDSGGPYLCTMHANETVALDDGAEPPA